MPTLGGPFDLFGREPPEACRWCGEPTHQRLAPIESTREPIPLHAFCGAEVIVAYERLLGGGLLDTDMRKRLADIAGPPSTMSGSPPADE